MPSINPLNYGFTYGNQLPWASRENNPESGINAARTIQKLVAGRNAREDDNWGTGQTLPVG
jgi:hypothetical protein